MRPGMLRFFGIGKMKNLFVGLFYSLIIFNIMLAAEWHFIPDLGRLVFIQSLYAPFPHPERSTGYTYRDTLYSFEDHYNDSNVAIFVPEDYRASKQVDLVFYFHGWWNNTRQAMNQYKLLEQFAASPKNAIFVFPEGPKNAPDSFGGRLEEKNSFMNLVEEVLAFLQREGITTSYRVGKVILAGHSGAYQVMAFILNRGGLTDKISEVYLFDALYGQTEKYAHWLEKYKGRLINIITTDGGTMQESRAFLQNLADWNVSYYEITGIEFELKELRNERIVFIFTQLNHNAVLEPYFLLFLQSSDLPDK